MAQVDVPLVRAQFAQTSRRDNWWIQPLAVFLGLSTFIVYSTWAALQGDHAADGGHRANPSESIDAAVDDRDGNTPGIAANHFAAGRREQ